MKLENDLRSDPIRPLVLRIAIPSMLAQFVSVLYSVVDRMYIGNIAQVGSLALAGAGVCGPIVTMLGSVAFWVGVGGSPLISIRMGEGRQEEARRVLANCFLLLTCLALALTGLAYATRRPALLLFGASPETLPYAMDYYSYYLTGTVFALLSTGMNQFIICQGFAKKGMQSVMLGAVLNIILDPVMILVLGWGVSGAALATIIGNIAACLFYISYYVRGKSMLSIHLKDFKMGDGIAAAVASIGIPASLNNILMSFANIILNQALVGYGDTPVAAMGVALKSNMLVVLLQIGLCMGIQPLIGYNYGSRNKKRLMQVFKFTGVVSVMMGVILTLFMIIARKTMIQVFIDDAEVVAYGIRMVVALQLSAPFIGILFLCINTIQGMGKALPSLILTVCRQGLIFIPLIFLLNSMFGLDGVIYAQPTADYLSILVGILICVHLFRSMEHREHEN